MKSLLKKLSRKLCRYGFCIGLLVGMVLPTSAATPTYGHGYLNGVGNLSVYIDYNSGVGYWQTYIDNAVNN